jgi:hypothetical protein
MRKIIGEPRFQSARLVDVKEPVMYGCFLSVVGRACPLSL